MSKSVVSNDALWEKLSEIEEIINKSLNEQKTAVPAQEQVDIAPFIKADKEEIIERLGKFIQGLGTHCDSHFSKIRTDSEQSTKHIHGVYEILSAMWGWMQENEKEREAKEQENRKAEPEQEADKSCLNVSIWGKIPRLKAKT